MTASDLLSKLVTRLRGPAHSTALMYQILSHCQRLVNLHYRPVLVETSLTTTPEQVFYPLTASGAMRVEGVQAGVRDLKRASLRELGYLSRAWGRARAETLRLWGTAGRVLWFLYPASGQAQTVTVLGAKLLADLADPADAVEVPDDYANPLLDLAEAVLLIKERRHESVVAAVQRLNVALGIENVKSHGAGTGR